MPQSTVFEPAQRRRHRDWIQALVDDAAWLCASDRALVEQVYRHGLSITRLARAADVPARSLQRRLTLVLQRMKHPIFRFMVEKPDLVPTHARPVATLWAFEGVPIRQIADRLHVSLHTVRLQLHEATALARLWGYR